MAVGLDVPDDLGQVCGKAIRILRNRRPQRLPALPGPPERRRPIRIAQLNAPRLCDRQRLLRAS